jgi:glycosyltransferase involved in cell wall biosynthesis
MPSHESPADSAVAIPPAIAVRVPRVGVILPTYNRAGLVARAASSVLRQTFSDLELCIVDDGSTDGTPQAVAAIGDSRVRYERIDHRGPAAARNHGMARASGEYVAFIDSDDEWLPEKLERQMAVFVRYGTALGLVYTAARWQSDVSGKPVGIFPVRFKGPGSLFDQLLRGPSPIPFSSVLVRRECTERVGGFDESLASAEDREWLLRLARRYDFFGLDEIHVVRHVHAGSMRSENLSAKIEFEEEMMRRYRDDLMTSPSATAHALMRIGGMRLRLGDWQGARADFRRAAGCSRSYLPAYAYWIASALGEIAWRLGLHQRSAWLRKKWQLGWRLKKGA